MNYNKGYRINTKKNKNVSYECGRNDRIFVGEKIVFIYVSLFCAI